MKFDITRAWKDEAYRQTLSPEQLEILEANPVGELDEAALAEIFGGDMPDFAGVAAASSSSSRHTHSFSLLCDINIFSLDVPVLAVPRLINIATCEKQICINRE